MEFDALCEDDGLADRDEGQRGGQSGPEPRAVGATLGESGGAAGLEEDPVAVQADRRGSEPSERIGQRIGFGNVVEASEDVVDVAVVRVARSGHGTPKCWRSRSSPAW